VKSAQASRHCAGEAFIVEECDGELRLKPAAVLEFELYSDSQINERICLLIQGSDEFTK